MPETPDARPAPAPQPGVDPPHPPAGGAPVHRDYAGNGIVVHWKAERCIHTGRCIAAQPQVFDPRRRPWVDPSQAVADAIAAAVERCPTGALTYTRTDGHPQEAVPDTVTIRVWRDGPLAVHGAAAVAGEHRGPLGTDGTAAGRFTLCRCGRTAHAPFCDNSHRTLARGWGEAPGPPAPAPAPPAAVPARG